MDKVALYTERLVLVAPTLSDVGAITEAGQDPELQRRVPIPVPYTARDAELYVTAYSDSGWSSAKTCTWGIFADTKFAGVIGLDGIGDGMAEIGYWMVPAFRGRGFLTEAAHFVGDLGIAAMPTSPGSAGSPERAASAGLPDSRGESAGLGLQRIQWRAYAGNVASAIVAQRVGFRFEGVHRLGAMGRAGREDDWAAGMLATDSRHPEPWPVLP